MISQIHLSTYISELRRQGRSLFSKEEALKTLGIAESPFFQSVSRLTKKKALAPLKGGLYQIIPEEYRTAESLPPEWFIDGLMKHLGIPYYVGLLSAATIYGSTHQAPQIFQVVSLHHIPVLKAGKHQVAFYSNKDLEKIPTQKVKVPTGYMTISTVEATAFDLLKYLHQAGHLNHIATLLSELAGLIDQKKLVATASLYSIRFSQRLGYLLDILGFEDITEPLCYYIKQARPIYIPLRSDASTKDAIKNKKWHLLVNEAVEPDL